MLYHKICKKPVSWIGKKIKSYSNLAKKSVLPVIQSISEPLPLSPAESREAVWQTKHKKSLGVMVLSWEGMNKKLRLGWQSFIREGIKEDKNG